jgi:tetratricopeptide (TPR) repeat protein
MAWPQHSGRLLHAFYDFAVGGISFDFAAFITLAEVERARRGFDGIHLVIVPGLGDGFHPNPLYDVEHKQWRLRNIILPVAHLLPSLAALSLCASRDEGQHFFDAAGGNVYPTRYQPDKPLTTVHTGWCSLAACLGHNVQVLSASPQARRYARQWLDARAAQRRAVVITLREASFRPERNTDPALWAELAHALATKGYFPVIIRDIERSLDPTPREFEGLTVFPEGPFNLDLRLALYEEAFLHVSVNNGASSLCGWDRNVQFVFVVGPEEFADPVPRWAGVAHGKQLPYYNRFQRHLWQRPDVSTLMNEIIRMAALIDDAHAEGSFEARLASDPANREPLIEGARRYRDLGEWDLLADYAAALTGQSPSKEAYYLAALAEFKIQASWKRGNGAAAERALRTGLALPAGDADDERIDAEMLRMLGEPEAAVEVLERLARNANDTISLVQLARLHAKVGRSQDAAIACRRALARGIDASIGADVYGELGDILINANDPTAAVELYRHALSRGIGHPLILFRMGAAFEFLGDVAAAITIYEKLVEHGSTNRAVVARLAALQA